MDPPRSIKELVEEAHNYEFSTSLPLRIYLRTADTLNRHADLFKKSESYSDAYILYVRFLDLVMNKISKYPKLKQDHNTYKTYLSLITEKAPIALKNAEEVREILEKEIQKYNHYTSLQQRKEELRKSLLQKKRQLSDSSDRDHYQQNNKNAFINSVDRAHKVNHDHKLFDEEKFNESLKQFHSITEKASELEPSYPALPQFHHYEVLKPSNISAIEEHPSPPAKKLELQPLYSESLPPSLPPKHQEEDAPKVPEHKSIAKTEGGIPMKTVFIPSELEAEFLKIANKNTINKLETCGILCGKLSHNAFFITTLLIPDQDSTANTCNTTNEESIFEFIDAKDLFVLGWIHTHPTQTCFLSSVDLHTQNSYQIMLPEAMAIVCAPRSNPNFGVFRLTDPPGIGVITKCQRRGFHPHEESNIYKRCGKEVGGHVILKKGLPFECADLRTSKK